ncbi:hypothetical protein Afil01_30640 [Actinorhabdospora filicis]|uniref:Uncharacterized protein n=1 Tax=Actinorhabdospora filicis TaxID=1785913 RepID=A0A9W6SM11_9ACTN|nr:SitI3 family protein [Actinorhabdospora filicis]GLZ78257.1 hypothetical protein Afil01_30640 [Actinorhabdospora filicis]
MAIEYVLETIDDIPLRETLRYLAAHMGADVREDGFATREGLHIMAAVMPADDIATTELLLGYRDVVSTTFRLLNNTHPAVERRNLTTVLTAVVSFLDETPAMRGVFTHEGERILLQRITPEPVIFDRDWRRYTLDVAQTDLDAIESGHRSGRLLQPALSDADLRELKAHRGNT